jgi:hypothetical protein
LAAARDLRVWSVVAEVLDIDFGREHPIAAAHGIRPCAATAPRAHRAGALSKNDFDRIVSLANALRSGVLVSVHSFIGNLEQTTFINQNNVQKTRQFRRRSDWQKRSFARGLCSDCSIERLAGTQRHKQEIAMRAWSSPCHHVLYVAAHEDCILPRSKRDLEYI